MREFNLFYWTKYCRIDKLILKFLCQSNPFSSRAEVKNDAAVPSLSQASSCSGCLIKQGDNFFQIYICQKIIERCNSVLYDSSYFLRRIAYIISRDLYYLCFI
jgi:hypothetical protein